MRPLLPVLVRQSQASHPLRAAVVGGTPGAAIDGSADWSQDLRFFATAWLGGLIFFGTLLA
jgi:hypothetical protein